MQKKALFAMSACVLVFLLAGCEDPTDHWDTPPSKDITLDKAYKECRTTIAAGALLKTGASEFDVYDVLATDISSTKPERRAFKVLIGPNTEANIGADGSLNLISGWAYLWGKWPRARTARVTASAKGSGFAVLAEAAMTHVLYMDGTFTDVEKYNSSGTSTGSRQLVPTTLPYIAITHNDLPIELTLPEPTVSTGVGVFIDEVKAMGPVFAGQD